VKRSRSTLRVVLGGAVAGGVGLVQAVSAQNAVTEPAGLRVVLDYSLGLDADTNYRLLDESPGNYFALVNAFDFALLSNTRNESFELRFGTELRFASDPGSDDAPIEWTDPNFMVLYTRDALNSRLSVSSDLRIRDADTVEPFFLDVDGDAIIDEAGFEETTGTLTDFGVNVTLETGINAPIGTTYTAAYQSRTYTDTDDPDLSDRVDYRVGTFTRLRFSAVTTGTVELSARQYEYSGGDDLEGQNLTGTVGVIHEFSPILVGEASIGYAKTHEEEDQTGGTVTTVNHGIIGSAELTRELSDGTLFGEFRRNLVEDTFRNTLSFGRSIALAHYSLDGSFGISNLDGGDIAPVFGLAYNRPLPDGLLTLSVNRTVTLDTDDNERTLSTAFVGYSREINEVSSFNLGLDYALITGVGDEDAGDDETRATFTATYQHALTEDWAMNVGYRGRTRTSDTEDAISNAIFVNVGRRFTFR
jgi:hypothetical protein